MSSGKFRMTWFLTTMAWGRCNSIYVMANSLYTVVGKVTFAEERTVNTGSRVFSGFSVPIGAGVYFHVGASQAGKVSGLLPIDVGAVLVTSQALYFGGQQRTLRISLSNVLRYEPYADGVGVCEAAGPPKVFVPDYSGMDTGWFLFNLLSTLTSKLPGPC